MQTNLTVICENEYWKCNSTLLDNKMSPYLSNLEVVRSASLSFKLFVRNMDERNTIYKNFLRKDIDACAFLKSPKSATFTSP